MFAITKLHEYLRSGASPEATRELTRLLDALSQEKEFPLSNLYEIDYEAFELAMEALRDWRIDRYYAGPAALVADVGTDLPQPS
jgi:hypothetical protein